MQVFSGDGQSKKIMVDAAQVGDGLINTNTKLQELKSEFSS